MDRGTWWAIVHGSQRVRLDRKTNTFAFTFIELEEPENMFANPSLKNTRTFPKLPALRQNSVSPLQNMKIIEENNQFPMKCYYIFFLSLTKEKPNIISTRSIRKNISSKKGAFFSHTGL